MSISVFEEVKIRAEIARLRAKLAEKKPDNGVDGDPDEIEDEETPSDVDSPKAPKKGKAKKKAEDNEEDDEGNPADDDAPKPDDVPDKRPAPPMKNDDDQEKDARAYRLQVAANVKAVLAADAKRRGVVSTIPAAGGDDAYWGQVSLMASAIVAADKRRRGDSRHRNCRHAGQEAA